MNTTTIERVAKGVRRRRFERTGAIRSFDEDVPPTENELDDARAAIEAMREQTPEMVEAARRAPTDLVLRDSLSAQERARIAIYWRAMIDAALNEKEAA